MNCYAELDDAALVKKAKRNPDAFDALYHRYVERIYRYCYTRTGNRADAQDLTSQVFLAALESLRCYREQNTFAAWLFSIARNICAHHHRERYTHPHVTLENDNGEICPLHNTLSISEITPEQTIARKRLLGCIRQALCQLSDDRREALWLRFWGDLSAREVAEIMKRDTGAVKMLIWRGINDLRRRCLDEA